MMRTTLVLGLLAISAAVAAGCSDDSDSNGAAGSTGTAGSAGSAVNPTSTCKADYDRQVKCGQTPADEATYIQKCKAQISCWSSVMIADYITTYFPCAVTRECGASDDHCADSVYEQQIAIPEVKAAYDTCMARYDACCADGGECAFADDECGLILIAQSAVRAELAACVQKAACEETANCFGSFMAKYADCNN